MDETRVVTCVLRHRDRVLLLERSDAVGSYAGRWGMVAGHAEGRPNEQCWVEIEEETGVTDACTLVRAGDPFAVVDDDRGTRWVVHPFLFDCGTTEIEPNEETATWEWVTPPEIRERDTVPALWQSYRAVAPTVETVREDDEHGSAYVSVRALEVLRDAAVDGETWPSLTETARRLHESRDMTAVENSVNRAMSTADGSPDALVDTTQGVIDDALDADEAAADEAAARIAGDSVLTLSRSGTVQRALERGSPDRVVVAESRPAREGVGVAEELATAGVDVTLTTDAAAPGLVAGVDRVLVGADAVEPGGHVVNKTGTYPLALAAARADVPLDVVCARDKIATGPVTVTEESDPEDVYSGDADVSVEAPLFERTPGDLVAAVVTETGVLDADALRTVATTHREHADWE